MGLKPTLLLCVAFLATAAVAQRVTPPPAPSSSAPSSGPQAPQLPDYSKRNNIYMASELSPVPHAIFYSVKSLAKYRKCMAKNAESDAQHQQICPDYEYQVPYSTTAGTVQVGQKLRAAWQRFEDRYYWRAMIELNNPLMNVTHCLIDWNSGLNTSAPEVRIVTDNTMFPAELAGKIPEQSPRDNLWLDDYLPVPKVPNADYCDDLQADTAVMYLPGSCFYLETSKLFCIEGETPNLAGAPKPINFDMAAAALRVGKATKRAETTYQAAYAQDVLSALTPSLSPSTLFFPLFWSSPVSGAVIAPTMSLGPNMADVFARAGDAASRLGGVFQLTAYPYYMQGLTSNKITLPLRVHLLPGSGDVVHQPPGVWKLEEFKRTFPVNAEPVYERFGYTNVFQAWSKPEVKLLPEQLQNKPLRQMIYMASGINVYLQIPPIPPIITPVPAPVLIPAFAAGLPYAGVQTHFGWVSVAEGYDVPRVSGTPPLNYKSMFR